LNFGVYYAKSETIGLVMKRIRLDTETTTPGW